MSRKPCCVGEGLKKGAWTTEEDKKLISYIHDHGEGGWRDIPQKAGLYKSIHTLIFVLVVENCSDKHIVSD
jgi:hypothetical protein